MSGIVASLRGERVSGLMRHTAARSRPVAGNLSSPSSQGLAPRRCHPLEPDGEGGSRPGLTCVCPWDLSSETQLSSRFCPQTRGGLGYNQSQ